MNQCLDSNLVRYDGQSQVLTTVPTSSYINLIKRQYIETRAPLNAAKLLKIKLVIDTVNVVRCTQNSFWVTPPAGIGIFI